MSKTWIVPVAVHITAETADEAATKALHSLNLLLPDFTVGRVAGCIEENEAWARKMAETESGAEVWCRECMFKHEPPSCPPGPEITEDSNPLLDAGNEESRWERERQAEWEPRPGSYYDDDRYAS